MFFSDLAFCKKKYPGAIVAQWDSVDVMVLESISTWRNKTFSFSHSTKKTNNISTKIDHDWKRYYYYH